MACAAIKQVPSQRSRKSSRARRPATPLALQGRSARAPRPDRSADKVTLYTSRYCPYSQRVAFLAEVANDARIETMEVDHRNKPEWFNLLAQSAGMPPQVPLCRASFEGYQARVFNQSLIINQFLADVFELPQVAKSAMQRAFMQLYMKDCDQTFVPSGFRFLSAPRGTDEETKAFRSFYHHLSTFDQRLSTSGGAFLGGDALTLADIAYIPFISRFEVACKHFKNYDFLRGPNNFGRIRRWMHHVRQMEEFKHTSLDHDEIVSLYEDLLGRDYFRSFQTSSLDWRGYLHPAEDTAFSCLDTMKAVAEECADILRRRLGAAAVKQKANERDIVTEVDNEVQELVQRKVKQRHPGHAFLGEESVGSDVASQAEATKDTLANQEWVWIVDPLDGTTNYSCGMPLNAVSIAVAHRGEVVAGIICDPFSNETFHALKGGGAFLNDLPIGVSEANQPSSAVVGLGYSAAEGAAGPVSRALEALSHTPVNTVRMLGSASLMLAWVAVGRLSAYAEADLNAWDTAAGALIVQEAGGRVTGLSGGQYTPETRPVLASNGSCHDSILQILQSVSFTGLDNA